jgi:hypothetical protein
MKLSSAVTSVRAIETATATAAAAPLSPRNMMPTTVRPRRAMITVAPAKTTADPAVPTARAMASGTGAAPRSSARYLAMMKRQ